MKPTEFYHKILAVLGGAGVPYEHLEHEHVHSSEDAAKVRGTKLEEAAKALVLKTGSGEFLQCVVAGHRKLDLRKIKSFLGEKNVALAHPDEVLARTGCPVGTVPPFGTLFDPPLRTLADTEVFSRDHVCFSAASHYHSIRMASQDWKSIVGAEVVDIGKEV